VGSVWIDLSSPNYGLHAHGHAGVRLVSPLKATACVRFTKLGRRGSWPIMCQRRALYKCVFARLMRGCGLSFCCWNRWRFGCRTLTSSGPSWSRPDGADHLQIQPRMLKLRSKRPRRVHRSRRFPSHEAKNAAITLRLTIPDYATSSCNLEGLGVTGYSEAAPSFDDEPMRHITPLGP